MTKTLDEIMSGRGEAMPETNEAANEAPQTTPEAQSEPAPQTLAADAVDAQDRPDGNQGTVPTAALHAERQKVKRYTEEVADMRRQMADMQTQFQSQLAQLVQATQQRQPPQPQPDPPDWYADPQAAIAHNLAPIQQETAAMREQFSRMMAADKFGEETVNTAQTELEQFARSNPQAARFDYQRIMASPHPYAALVEWHRQRATLSEVGPDPKAYRERVRAEILAEMQGARPAPAPNLNPAATPSNFATSRSAAPNSAPTFTGPRSLTEIMGR
jgi:DNA repair exonuclease SbcCD ATPase subunit